MTFNLFKINMAKITERWKRQLKYSSHFTINKMGFRNCICFAFCIIKIWCRVDIAMHVRLLNYNYQIIGVYHESYLSYFLLASAFSQATVTRWLRCNTVYYISVCLWNSVQAKEQRQQRSSKAQSNLRWIYYCLWSI